MFKGYHHPMSDISINPLAFFSKEGFQHSACALWHRQEPWQIVGDRQDLILHPKVSMRLSEGSLPVVLANPTSVVNS